LPDNGGVPLFSRERRERPPLTSEPVAWEELDMTPRWLGDDSSSAVAASQPSNMSNHGAVEWDRFLAGTRARSELALAISMIGSPEEPEIRLPFGPSASVSLPGSEPDTTYVGGPRIPLARPPSPAPSLGRADRDLALRLVNGRDATLPWWSLHLSGVDEYPPGGGPSRRVGPTGTLLPLLISATAEVVAAIWTSPDGAIRHYVIPWLPRWTPVLQWLSQRAIPELVPSAARRIHGRIGEEPALQTSAESSALAALAQLDDEYQIRRDEISLRHRHPDQ
jgi:hypothetical protein